MAEDSFDLAVSFAGEHRVYVEAVVNACKALGLTVFYDRDRNNEWWGNSFIREQRVTYSSQARFFVPFLSQEYVSKPIPMDEFSSAMMTAVKRGDGYILPVLMDDVQVPADLLHPHIHYLRSSDYSPDELADQLLRKVQGATSQGQAPRPVGDVVKQAMTVRLPKVVPNDWSKYEELDRLFSYLAERFEMGAAQLRAQGIVCTVRRVDSNRLAIRAERNGVTIAALDIRRGLQMGDDHITWSVGPRAGDSSFNGWATPTFDKDAGTSLVEVSDLANFGSDGRGRVSYEALFASLWDKVIEQIERE